MLAQKTQHMQYLLFRVAYLILDIFVAVQQISDFKPRNTIGHCIVSRSPSDFNVVFQEWKIKKCKSAKTKTNTGTSALTNHKMLSDPFLICTWLDNHPKIVKFVIMPPNKFEVLKVHTRKGPIVMHNSITMPNMYSSCTVIYSGKKSSGGKYQWCQIVLSNYL